jgi:hypothetical protein
VSKVLKEFKVLLGLRVQ